MKEDYVYRSGVYAWRLIRVLTAIKERFPRNERLAKWLDAALDYARDLVDEVETVLDKTLPIPPPARIVVRDYTDALTLLKELAYATKKVMFSVGVNTWIGEYFGRIIENIYGAIHEIENILMKRGK